MSHAKKKPPVTRKPQQNQINKKALIWIAAVFGVVVIAVGIMLALKI